MAYFINREHFQGACDVSSQGRPKQRMINVLSPFGD